MEYCTEYGYLYVLWLIYCLYAKLSELFESSHLPTNFANKEIKVGLYIVDAFYNLVYNVQ